MSKAYVDRERCKGCELCASYCPKEALSLSHDINGAGYNFMIVDEESCIGCGMCYTVCPDGVFTITDKA